MGNAYQIKRKNWLQRFTGLWRGMLLTLSYTIRRGKRKNSGPKADNYFDQAQGTVTLQYPHEKLPVPENGRYQLHVEIDDCIVCDLCAKICPVDCIDIISIKSVEDMGKTSDGTTKRLHAAKFDIDMGKCMFCGLCTIVCPTECITMTDEYDRSFSDPKELIYLFSFMTEAEAEEKRAALAKSEAEKKAAKEAALKAAQEAKKTAEDQ